jgi:hypothetical protein
VNREAAHAEAVRRADLRACLGLMSDPELAEFLGKTYAWETAWKYRAAWHEATVARNAPGIPRI